jgi:hypothetical protein
MSSARRSTGSAYLPATTRIAEQCVTLAEVEAERSARRRG